MLYMEWRLKGADFDELSRRRPRHEIGRRLPRRRRRPWFRRRLRLRRLGRRESEKVDRICTTDCVRFQLKIQYFF